jgi:hypothetical protein
MNDQSDLLSGSRAVADYRALQREQAEAAGMRPPAAWASYRPAFFRLPGVDGSALFLRTTVLPEERSDVVAVDVGLLSVQQFLWLLGREATPGFTVLLSQFFIAAASEEHPEGSTDIAGFAFDVVDSDLGEVELLVRLEPDRELSLRTTRSALMQAGLDVRGLEPAADPTTPDWL